MKAIKYAINLSARLSRLYAYKLRNEIATEKCQLVFQHRFPESSTNLRVHTTRESQRERERKQTEAAWRKFNLAPTLPAALQL